jgi:hypothetical protein
MAFNPAFTVAQGIDPTSFTVIDSSTGSDPAIVNRNIYLQLSDGTYLTYNGAVSTPTPIPFPLSAGTSIDIVGILQVDYAISINVQWLGTGGILYELTQSYCFVGNDQAFMYGLVQSIAANQALLQNTNYITNCFELDMLVTYAQKAVETGNDIATAQMLLDLAQNMINNNTFFW